MSQIALREAKPGNNTKWRRTFRIWIRAIHRDLGYFFVGLILAYAVSGIALNHRQSWNPREYIASSQSITTSLVGPRSAATEERVAEVVTAAGYDPSGIRDTYFARGPGDMLRIVLADQRFEIDLATGAGEIETVVPRHGLRETVFLHQTTDTLWIWFADVFGVAMVVIALTGMLMIAGKKGFRHRGIYLAALGLIFPLIVLFVIFY